MTQESALLTVIQFSSIAQSYPAPCNPRDCSTPGFPAHHQLPDLTQTYVHWVGDAISTISSSVVPFSSCLRSFPASRSFQMSQFFASGGQSIGVSASALVLPINIQDWFPLGWLVVSPCSPKDSQESSPTSQLKSISSSAFSFLYSPSLTSIHDYRKNQGLTRWTFVGKVISWFFNMVLRLVINFLPRSKCLLISWLQSPFAVILEPPKLKSYNYWFIIKDTSQEQSNGSILYDKIWSWRVQSFHLRLHLLSTLIFANPKSLQISFITQCLVPLLFPEVRGSGGNFQLSNHLVTIPNPEVIEGSNHELIPMA